MSSALNPHTTEAILVASKGRTTFPLRCERMIIGRTSSCNVVLQDRMVSRKHAEILRESFGFVVRDLKSKNGTFVNGKRIGSSEARRLSGGDRLLVGSSQLEFHDPAATVAAPGLVEDLSRTPIFLDPKTMESFVAGKKLTLTPKEFSLLELLLERPGEVRRRVEIAQFVWPEHGGRVSNYNIDVLISRLRHRLTTVGGPKAADWLVTVKKRGYRFTCAE